MPAPALLAAIPALSKLIMGTIDKTVKDKDLAEKLKAQANSELLNFDSKSLEAASSIIVAEAKSEHVLTATWRPLTMLTFTGLIVARWFGLTVDIPPEIEAELWTVVQLGIGGYVVSRGVEKTAKTIASRPH